MLVVASSLLMEFLACWEYTSLATAEHTSSKYTSSRFCCKNAGRRLTPTSPAITFTNCVLRKLPWRRFPMFFLGQFLGGFVGAGVVYANYVSSIDWYEDGLRTVPPSPTATAAIFCTYPQEHLTKASQFFSEFIASAILMFVIFALKDDSNKGSFSASGEWFPLGLFFLIFGLGSCFGKDLIPCSFQQKHSLSR